MNQIEIPRIELSARRKKDIAKEFGITEQAVRNALKYFSNSESAIKVRSRAIELLKDEANSSAVFIVKK